VAKYSPTRRDGAIYVQVDGLKFRENTFDQAWTKIINGGPVRGGGWYFEGAVNINFLVNNDK